MCAFIGRVLAPAPLLSSVTTGGTATRTRVPHAARAPGRTWSSSPPPPPPPLTTWPRTILRSVPWGQTVPFLSFPYVCPEPVLVKCSFLYINGSKGPFLLTACRPRSRATMSAWLTLCTTCSEAPSPDLILRERFPASAECLQQSHPAARSGSSSQRCNQSSAKQESVLEVFTIGSELDDSALGLGQVL